MMLHLSLCFVLSIIFYFRIFVSFVPLPPFLFHVLLSISLSSSTSPHMLVSLSPSSVKIFLSLFQPRSVDFSPPSSSIPRVFVAHTRIPDSVLLAFAASTLDTSLHCYLPSVPVSFSLICLYPQPTVVSHFLVAFLFLANAGIPLIYLSPSPFYMYVILCPLLLPSSLFVDLILFPFSVVVRSP